MDDKTLSLLYAEHDGKVSDRWSLYLSEYERVLAGFRKLPIRMLEIGIQNGGSLEIWSKYFPNANRIVGCDIDPACSRLHYEDSRIAVVVGDANSDDTQRAILRHSREFEVVIDDGSHLSSDVIKSFARYFPNVTEGGVFIVEDLHCSYWQKHEGGLFDPFSSVAFFKLLLDVINHEHWGVAKQSTELFKGFVEKCGVELEEHMLAQVHSIEFVNSLCVVRKSAPHFNQVGARLIAGTTEQVVSGLKDVSNEVPSQTDNPWSSRDQTPNEELLVRLQELAERDSQIAGLSQAVDDRDNQVAILSRAVEERDNQITTLGEAVEEHGNQIASLSESMERRDSQLASLSQSVADNERHIAGLGQSVEDRDRQIASLGQCVRDRDDQIARLIQSLVEREDRISDLNRCAQDRESRISLLRHSVEERKRRNTKLRRSVEDRGRRIVALRRSVELGDSRIAGLSQSVEDHKKEIAALGQVAEDRNKRIADMTASMSWRITRPMRAARGLFRRRFNASWYLEQNPDVAASGRDPYEHYVTHGMAEGRRPAPDHILRRSINRISMARRLVQRKGGFVEVCKSVVTLLRREGWQGVKRKMSAPNAEMAGILASEWDRHDYSEWVSRYDTLTDEVRASMRSHMETLPRRPVMSVVMPVYNPKPKWLTEAIESVQGQIYPHWELCIADDASTDSRIRPLLENFARNDSRIKVVFREENGHIAAASNSALELATGEWIALLDHDDLLPEHALYWVADALGRDPDARLIYSDEDKIDERGRRQSPYFKCDWNQDLFYSQNMFSHLGVYQRELVDEVGGFRVGFEGSQDYDLALRCIEQVDAGQIHHIPRVLYHWRAHGESVARSGDTKPYAAVAGERALNEHFNRLGVNAVAQDIGHGYRVKYAVPESPPLVSLIIPTRNGLTLIRQCIESIVKKTTYPNYEIIVVDNGSDDPDVLSYLDSLSVESRIRIIRDDRPFNYSALNNAAVDIARGELVGLINNDIDVISPDWLTEMVSHALRPEVGAVGARLWYPNETLQHGGIVLGLGGIAGHAHHKFHKGRNGYFGRAGLISSFSAVTAACLIVERSIYKQVGGLNEKDLTVAFGDVDFCLRAREAGYRNIWTPHAELYHHESATRGHEDTPEKQARFAAEIGYMQERWGKCIEHDPAYSPNLTLEHADFSYAWPPRIDVDSFHGKSPPA